MPQPSGGQLMREAHLAAGWSEAEQPSNHFEGPHLELISPHNRLAYTYTDAASVRLPPLLSH